MMLDVHSLRVSYGRRQVLKDIQFSLPPGGILGIVGPNGAGKTTLIRALSGVLPLSGGSVQVGGKDLAGLSSLERARLVAVVPQARSLPPAFSGRELVLLGRTPHLNWLGHVSPEDEEAVCRALQRANATELAGRPLGELSGGEQQRLLLARALAQEAPLLLLDEPTTHLDLQYQVGLLDQVRDLVAAEGKSVVVALHDLNLVSRYADRVLLLVEGEMRACGAPSEVLQPDLLAQVYKLPLQVLHNPASGLPIILPAVL